MLVLTRKLMEKLYIGDDICVTVVRLEGGQVRLGIEAPRQIPVVRAELRRDPPPGSGPDGDARLRRPRRARTRGSRLDQPRLAEAVADAANGLDEVGALAELLAEALDVDVDGALQHHGVLADGRIHQFMASERPTGLTEQGLQQAELRRRQREAPHCAARRGGGAGR